MISYYHVGGRGRGGEDGINKSNFAVTKWELHDFHKMGFNGKDVVIAIIDSGIDRKHDAFNSDDKIHPDSRNFLEPQSDKDTTDAW